MINAPTEKDPGNVCDHLALELVHMSGMEQAQLINGCSAGSREAAAYDSQGQARSAPPLDQLDKDCQP